jgi:hypothetical protein
MRDVIVVGALWCVAVEQLERACWRGDGGCTCRELTASERAFGP